MKSHDLGYSSSHILNAIEENFSNLRTQNEPEENRDDANPHKTLIPNDLNQHLETPIRQENSVPSRINQIPSNVLSPLLKDNQSE